MTRGLLIHLSPPMHTHTQVEVRYKLDGITKANIKNTKLDVHHSGGGVGFRKNNPVRLL